MSNTVEFQIQDIYFKCIKSGVKNFEGRRLTEKVTSVKPGDCIIMVNSTSGEKLPKIVKKIYLFGSIEEMVHTTGYLNLIPSAESEAEAISTYYSFPNYGESKSFAVFEFKD